MDIAEIQDQATAVFGNEQMAAQWLAQSNPWLEGQRPLDLLHSQRGVKNGPRLARADEIRRLLLTPSGSVPTWNGPGQAPGRRVIHGPVAAQCKEHERQDGG